MTNLTLTLCDMNIAKASLLNEGAGEKAATEPSAAMTYGEPRDDVSSLPLSLCLTALPICAFCNGNQRSALKKTLATFSVLFEKWDFKGPSGAARNESKVADERCRTPSFLHLPSPPAFPSLSQRPS